MGLNTRVTDASSAPFKSLVYLSLSAVMMILYTVALQALWTSADLLMCVLQSETVVYIMKAVTSPNSLITIIVGVFVANVLRSHYEQISAPMKRQVSIGMKRQISIPMKEMCLMSALGGALG
jgi:uncharacterized metal-binding protein